MIKSNPNCILCKLCKTSETICQLGKGSKDREIVVVTESPRGDRIATEMLDKVGFEFSDLYFCSAVACDVEKGKSATKSQIKQCTRYLLPQLDQAKYVLLVGSGPLLAVLGLTGIKKLHGRPIKKDGVIYLPIMSPGIIHHDPGMRPMVEAAFRFFKEIVEFEGVPEEKDLDFEIVQTAQQIRAMLKDMRGSVSSDLETSGLYPWDKGAHVVSIGFGTARKQWIIPGESADIWTRHELEEILEMVTDRLEECILIGHNWKFDQLWMKVRFGVSWPAQFDTMLAHYLLDENSLHGLKHLAQKFLGAPDWDVDKETKTEWSSVTARYHAHDLFYTRQLYKVFKKDLAEQPGVEAVFKHILMPCSDMFVQAEYNGVYIDTAKMDDAEKYLREELRKAKADLDKWAPDVNWRSPIQVASLLFDRLGIAEIEKTAAGGRSVSESVIKRIDHPVARAMLLYRAADKQLSGFIEGWKPYLVNGRLHPSFKLHGTVTGRLSCQNPNLQQIPRDPRIRNLITAPPGWVLLECDLSQIELRIAAEIAGETAMLDAFRRGIDVHWKTATGELRRGAGGDSLKTIYDTAKTFLKRNNLPEDSTGAAAVFDAWEYTNFGPNTKEVLHKFKAKGTPKKLGFEDAMNIMVAMGPDEAQDIDKGWKELRKKAKAVNFGFLFGMWWKKFKDYARDNYGVIVTDKQAKQAREAFFEDYPEFATWHKRQRMLVRRQGYVESLSGRKRRLPRAMDREDTPERREAERQSINSPVQSFANELNLMSALQIHREFKRSEVRIVGTVHDAILMEVKLEHIHRVSHRVLEIMKRPSILDILDIDIEVPILADGTIGPWGGGKSVEKYFASMH